MTIGKDWGDDTDYGGLVFYQVMTETAETNKKSKMEKYQNVLRQSGGSISPSWVLLDDQCTLDVFSEVVY